MLSQGCPVTSAILTTSKTDEKSEVLSEFFTRRLGNGKPSIWVLAVTFPICGLAIYSFGVRDGLQLPDQQQRLVVELRYGALHHQYLGRWMLFGAVLGSLVGWGSARLTGPMK